MTVQTSTSVATGIGNGVTTVFPVGYKFNDDADLVVLRIDDATSAAETLTLNSDYTVQGAGNENGGSITLTAGPLAVGKTLTITRIVDILQLTDLRNQGKFFAEVHEDAFDKFIMIMQQLFQAVGDSLQLNAARNRWDAKGRRIINVGDPVDAQDAVTKSWLEAYIAALLQTSIGPVQTAASVIIVAPNGDVFTLQDLANSTDPAKGAAIVGYAGSSVAARLNEFKGLSVVGSTSGESFVTGFAHNRISSTNTASVLLGGQVTQPNAIGKAVYVQSFVGDGTQDTFALTLPFVFESTAWTNLRANLIRDNGLFETSYTIDGGLVVTGTGTSSITVKTPTPVATGYELEVTVYGNTDAGNATLQLVGGYDNASAAIANIILSHHSISPAGSGHNAIIGGSYLRAYGSYNFIAGGTNNRIGTPASGSLPIGSFAAGRGQRVTGSAAQAFGENCKAAGSFSTAMGRECDSLADYSYAIGRMPATLCPGQFAIGCGAPSDTKRGLRQSSMIPFSRDTSNATLTFLQLANSSSTYPLPLKYASCVKVLVVANAEDDGECAAFEGTFLVKKGADGIAMVNGLQADVALTDVTSSGTGWTAAIRASGGGVGIRVAGEAGRNIRWTATLMLAETAWA